MSKRAEDAALKAYPEEMGMFHEADIHYEADLNKAARIKYIEGYEQAEKDLALTWEDMAAIDSIILDVNNEFAVDYSKEISRQKFYEEVLKRFNEHRKNG